MGDSVMTVGLVTESLDEADAREKVRKAAFHLMHDERRIPDPQNLSEKSGVPISLVNTLYPTIEDLAVDITDALDGNLAAQYDAFPEPGDLPDMLNQLVDLRVDLYEATAFVRTYSEVSEHMFPSIREKRAIRDGHFRAKIHAMLEPHFGAQTDQMATQVEALVSWEFWRHLRNVQRLSEERTRELVRKLVRQVSAAP